MKCASRDTDDKCCNNDVEIGNYCRKCYDEMVSQDDGDEREEYSLCNPEYCP